MGKLDLETMQTMQEELQERYKGKWPAICPAIGREKLLWMIAETGEASETPADAAFTISYLGAFIAVNLAVMNLLPIPALDGGRVFFLVITWVIEKIIRRKIDPKYEGYIHAAGMILLLSFIAFVTFKDIWKLFAA